MYKSDARIVSTSIGHWVMVEDRRGLSQWPILYSGDPKDSSFGRIAYDFPEHVPQCTKDKARKLLFILWNEPYYTPEA